MKPVTKVFQRIEEVEKLLLIWINEKLVSDSVSEASFVKSQDSYCESSIHFHKIYGTT